MYIVINGPGMLFGIFSSKKYMRIAIEQKIKDALETNGKPCGNFHFRYIKVKLNEPWFSEDGKYHSEVGKALFSLSTMHTEVFPNEVETDWTTGKIIKL